MEDKLLGHLLKANDAETDREVEQWLREDSDAARDLAALERVLTPMEVDREPIEPPSDLWIRTLSRVAEHIVATERPLISYEPTHTDELIRRAALFASLPSKAANIAPAPVSFSDALPSAPRRRNVVAIVGLSAALLALAFPGVIHARRNAQQTACTNTMRQFYDAASSYSDTNDGHFPQVDEGKFAATAADKLKKTGHLSPTMRLQCPAGEPDRAAVTTLANYAYSLGFRDESGHLWGLDRLPENSELPIMADAPIRQAGYAFPGNHRHGQNVLFAGGHVRFCTNSMINGDDIFLNADGRVGAGLSRLDTSLGRPEELP